MGKYESYSRTARINKEQDEFLNNHPEIVFSALVRDAIDARMIQLNEYNVCNLQTKVD
jgi:hypothetical protein